MLKHRIYSSLRLFSYSNELNYADEIFRMHHHGIMLCANIDLSGIVFCIIFDHTIYNVKHKHKHEWYTQYIFIFSYIWSDKWITNNIWCVKSIVVARYLSFAHIKCETVFLLGGQRPPCTEIAYRMRSLVTVRSHASIATNCNTIIRSALWSSNPITLYNKILKPSRGVEFMKRLKAHIYTYISSHGAHQIVPHKFSTIA